MKEEPAAHMHPSDLERFKKQETTATAFSVAVGRQGTEDRWFYLQEYENV